jgi:plasmid stability protein
MGQILIRRLDDAVLAALKERAARENASLEATARRVLTESVVPDRHEVFRRLARLRASQKAVKGPGIVALLRETRKRGGAGGAA